MSTRLFWVVVSIAFVLGAEDKPASISGVVRNAGSNTPLASAPVTLYGGLTPESTTTDNEGRFTFRQVTAGSYRISAEGAKGIAPFPPRRTKAVTVREGVSIAGLDLLIEAHARISGRILDDNKSPVPLAVAVLVAREYSLGSLRYLYARLGRTDDEGRYSIAVQPGRAYLLMAHRRIDKYEQAISPSPSEIKLRKRTYANTFYPGVPEIEAATPIVLQPGEHREDMDLLMHRSPSYCMDATAPPGSFFQLSDRAPSSGVISSGGWVAWGPPGGKAGADGKIRVCDLYPGTFVLPARNLDGPDLFYGSTEFNVVDRDVRNVAVQARSMVKLAVEVVAPRESEDHVAAGSTQLRLAPLRGAHFQGESTDASVEESASSTIGPLLVDSYSARITAPQGFYVKSASYGGQNLLAEPLRAGSASAGVSISIVLAGNGGTIAARVAGKDGKAIGDARVIVMPTEISSEAALAEAIVPGQCDQDGSWTSNLMAPGKYYVLALERPHDNSPESIGRIWAMRTKLKELDLGPGARAEIMLNPVD